MDQNISRYIKEIHIDAWTGYKSRVDSFKQEWIYRGQASADWMLSSSLERSNLLEIPEIEKILLNEYQRSARFYLNASETPTNTLDWLALLQHHGTPTRLIDFTRSPYIAAFFAFEKEEVDQSGRVAIWIANKIVFYQASLYYLRKNLRNSDQWVNNRHLYSDSVFDEIFKADTLDCIMPFESPNPNRRDLAQQSVFIATGNSQKKLVQQLEFLDYIKEPILTKVTMPRSIRKYVLRDLIKMNITPATLFPGLDGYSRAINMKYMTLATYGESGEGIMDVTKDGYAV